MKIELIPAFVWDCEHCGIENWQRSISVVLDPEDECDARVIRTATNLEPDEPIPESMRMGMSTSPTWVTCKSCNTQYEVTGIAGAVPDDED